MIAVIERPSKIITYLDITGGGAISTPLEIKWNASDNPVNYKFSRQDFQVQKVTAQSGNSFIEVTFVGAVTPLPLAGEQIYISCGQYSFVAVPTLVMPLANTVMQFDVLYIGDYLLGGYANLISARPGYYVEVQVWYKNGSGQYVYLTSRRGTPNVVGSLIMNIQSALKRLMLIRNDRDYIITDELYNDYNAYGRFFITYKEVYDGSTDVFQQDQINGAPYIHYVTTSVRQIQDKNGSNLAEYVPAQIDVLEKAKFISDFDVPTYFGDSYPWDIAIITSEGVENNSIVKEEGTYIGMTQQGIQQYNLTPLPLIGESRIMLAGGYSSDIDKVCLNLKLGGYVQQGYANTQYVDDLYWELVPPTTFEGLPYYGWIEKCIKIKQNCYDNPVYIAWKGMNGGWNYWLFYYRQEKFLESTVVANVTRPIIDLETAETVQEYIRKGGTDRMVIGADGLDDNDMRGLRKMLLSPKVQLYMGRGAANKPIWQTIRIAPGTFKIMDTRQGANDIEVSFLMPDTLTISQ